MNNINAKESGFRRERPESFVKILCFTIALICYIPYLIIVLAFALEKSFLIMLNQIAGKIREI